MAATPENTVKKDAKRALDALGAYWYMVVPTGYSRAGVPDFLACVPVTARELREHLDKLPDDARVGIFAGLEAKAPGKRSNTSALQDKELTKISEAGGITAVFDSEDVLMDSLRSALGEALNGGLQEE